ncbi:GNAT family N-acetyltransferase [Nocardiopsis aegyptia]|uniref:RimJ/RimL family protein N-acetyltransferase n=1 Tax=Nocardiopsis aegyptia TaxID=220378 RepID=A0A7Z0EJ54_9ACTN|nr:GNAT family protein [Nocardiopsis aegyptia]NYJ33038.1 RimJ/RimL family protein N-acetyltransferase [Nocardiopsis aegyptia]
MSDTAAPLLWAETGGVALGPLRGDLAREYWRWENDPGAVLGYGRQVPESPESRAEGLEHQLRGAPDQARFTVYDLKGDEPRPAGLASLLIDHQVRTAEYVLVVAPEARGKGVGTAATRLTLDYAFHVTGLDMVWLKVLEPNEAGRRAYAKAGFQEVGVLRSAGQWRGRRCGEVVMDAVPEDFMGASAFETAD